MTAKILVVDDEEAIVSLIAFNLKKAGYKVITASCGEEVLKLVRDENPDLVLLDIMLPGTDGLEVCRQIRQESLPVAIIMVTARDQEIDTVLGLEMGADDYITKPFSPRELTARVKAVLRRTFARRQAVGNNGIMIGDIHIDQERYEVRVKGEKIDLTPREFELLHILACNSGRVVPRDALLNRIWGYSYTGDTRIVDVHISHIRDKVEPNPKKPEYIQTIRGVGYRFCEPKGKY